MHKLERQLATKKTELKQFQWKKVESNKRSKNGRKTNSMVKCSNEYYNIEIKCLHSLLFCIKYKEILVPCCYHSMGFNNVSMNEFRLAQ